MKDTPINKNLIYSFINCIDTCYTGKEADKKCIKQCRNKYIKETGCPVYRIKNYFK